MTPIIRATLACACGMVAGLLLPAAAIPPLIAAVAGLVLVWGFGRRTRLLAAVGGGPVLLALFAMSGALAGALAGGRARSACATSWDADERLALRGYLAAAPVAGKASPFQPTGGACREEIRVSLPPRGWLPGAGEPVLVRGRWQPFPPETRWPVSAARLGLLRATSLLPDSGHAGSALIRTRSAAQLRLRQLLPRRHGVAEALVLARTEALEPGLRDTFVASGLAHLLAISGAHVVVFAGALLLLLRLLRAPLLPGRLLALLLIGVYVGAIGAPPAAGRAALQFGLLMAALLLQRPAHAWSLVAAAALALLAADPLNLLDAGFQLSFAGVAGMLAGRRRIAAALPAVIPKAVREGLATGLAATAATAPIAALHFGQFAPVGLVATLVASPVVGLALPGLAVLLLLAPIAPAAATLLAPGVELLLGIFLAIARAAARLPGGHFLVPASTLALLLLVGAGVLLALRHWRPAATRAPPPSPVEEQRRRRWRALGAVQALAAAAALMAWVPSLAPGSSYLELHVIDVGQGDAIAVRTPHGRWLLIDAGVRSARMDMGSRRVVPYLARHGARRLDLLLLSHPDGDHIGGAVSVLRAFAVGAVADPGLPGDNTMYLETLRAARTEPARWLALRSGATIRLDGVRLELLHPPAASLAPASDPNDLSLVFRLSFGRFAAMFPGDAPQLVEEQLAASRGAGLRAAVLKVGHHGSRTATAPAFLDAVQPRLALISVGRDNRYGHPDPAVVARLMLRGASVIRTDQSGSVVVRAWRSGRMRVGTTR